MPANWKNATSVAKRFDTNAQDCFQAVTRHVTQEQATAIEDALFPPATKGEIAAKLSKHIAEMEEANDPELADLIDATKAKYEALRPKDDAPGVKPHKEK